MADNITTKEIKNPTGSYGTRYVIVDKDTGNVLDDAQGYGYKTRQKAYAKRNVIKKWMKEHKDFVNTMDTFAFEIAKGSWGPDDKFDAKFVAEMLREWGLTIEFTPGELLWVWEKG